MTAGKVYGTGGGCISVTPDVGGVSVEVRGVGYSRSVLVPDYDRIRVARALHATEGFDVFDGFREAFLWATPESKTGWLRLHAATTMTYQDMQYPFVSLEPQAAVRVAELIDLVDPLANAKRQMDNNLQGVFG